MKPVKKFLVLGLALALALVLSLGLGGLEKWTRTGITDTDKALGAFFLLGAAAEQAGFDPETAFSLQAYEEPDLMPFLVMTRAHGLSPLGFLPPAFLPPEDEEDEDEDPVVRIDLCWKFVYGYPILPLLIRNLSGGSWVPVVALLDTGADVTVFSREDADRLGISVRRGECSKGRGVGGGILNICKHRIEMKLIIPPEVEDELETLLDMLNSDRDTDVTRPFRTDVWFVEQHGVMEDGFPLLGRQGFQMALPPPQEDVEGIGPTVQVRYLDAKGITCVQVWESKHFIWEPIWFIW